MTLTADFLALLFYDSMKIRPYIFSILSEFMAFEKHAKKWEAWHYFSLREESASVDYTCKCPINEDDVKFNLFSIENSSYIKHVQCGKPV